MKKIILLFMIVLLNISVQAQDIKGETITVLKGGITVIRFNADVVNFRLGNKEDYNINVEEGTSIRLWAKSGVTDPKTTNLIVTEGKRNHLFTIQYKEKGDFNSTYYDFSNLKELKKHILATSSANHETVKEIEKKEPEERPLAESVVISKEKDTKIEKKELEEKQKQLAKEKQERATLDKSLAEEKAKQDALDKQLANEKQVELARIEKGKKDAAEKNQKALTEKKAKEEGDRIAAEAKIQDELDKKIAAEKKLKEERALQLAKEKKAREEKEKKLLQSKAEKEENDRAVAQAQKEQAELNTKLAIEKKQREVLEKKLAEERAKRDANEKALTLETQKREQREADLAKETLAREAKETKLAQERKKREDADKKIADEKKKREEQERIAQEEREKYVPPPAEVDIRKKFPAIDFKEPPAGQFFDGKFFADTTAYYKASQTYLVQKEDSKFKNAGTEMDSVRIQLCNINFSGSAAYIRFKIENKTNHYFILGATMLKILEAESGKKYQLNPYYISSFPIIDANTSAYVIYVMKPEQNISPDSFVMMSIRERQSNKKFELNFPGNFYTDALKAVEK